MAFLIAVTPILFKSARHTIDFHEPGAPVIAISNTFKYISNLFTFMGTITVNIKDDVEKEFRKLVHSLHGARKGELGKALTEAMQKWIYEKKQEKIAQEALKLLDMKFNFGDRLYRNREDLYER